MVRDLVIRGEPSEILKFIKRIESVAPNGWRREPEAEERLRKFGVAPRGAYCFSWKGGEGRPAASVLLYQRGPGELSVSNIVAAERRLLTDEEYNNLLSGFKEDVLTPMSADLGVQPIIVEPRSRLEESLTSEAFRLLRSFSNAASKQPGPPLDLQEWRLFAFQTHRDEWAIDHEDLRRWLLDQGWPEESAIQLITELQRTRTILAAYDGQDSR